MADLILLSSVLESSIELWRPIEGFPGYEVSSLGRVRSLLVRSGGHKDGRAGVLRVVGNNASILKLGQHKQGYLQAYIYRDKKKYTRFVHTLVARAFIPNPDNLPEVNHITTLKSDNRVGNLEWKTRSGNQRHAWDAGVITAEKVKDGLFNGILKGKSCVARLTPEQVLLIRELYTQGFNQTEIAKQFGVSGGNICNIVNRKSWTFI